MKLLQYYADEELRLGIETEHGIIDVAAEAAKCAVNAPKTVMDVIRGGETAMRILNKLAANAGHSKDLFNDHGTGDDEGQHGSKVGQHRNQRVFERMTEDNLRPRA